MYCITELRPLGYLNKIEVKYTSGSTWTGQYEV